MTEDGFHTTLGRLGVINTYPDLIEHLECHFSTEEMARLKREPIFFYLGADKRDRERIWNAIECRLHKRERYGGQPDEFECMARKPLAAE